MSYDILVATRNRLAMLRHSVPLFLGQTTPPRRLVIVDASDDHEAVRRFHAEVQAGADVEIRLIEASQRNLPAQRNQGLDFVESEIVAMPDDDSLWFPDTGAALLKAYAADRDRAVGAINAVDARSSPLGGIEATLRQTPVSRVKGLVGPLRRRIETRFAPHPFDVFGEERIIALKGPERVDTTRFPLTPTVGGYRMSFRTEAIRAVRFNATLGHAVGYAQHEDKDAALRLLAAGWLIAAAPNARVFHNVHPSKRAGGFAYGFCQIYNYAYVCKTVFDPGSRAWRHLDRYIRLKLFLYSLRKGDAYGRSVWEGAKAAAAEAPALLAATPEAVEALFRRTCDTRLK